MKDMLVENCGGECVRLKNFIVNAEITGNTIRNCGVIDYFFDNGEDGKTAKGYTSGPPSIR
ncbi:unnamed protein product [Laminaria digitata]